MSQNRIANCKNTAIQFQAESEREHAKSLEELETLKEWFEIQIKLRGADRDMCEMIIQSMKELIDDLLEARMTVKQHMDDGVKDAVIINQLRFG